jgi:hypothetical protein
MSVAILMTIVGTELLGGATIIAGLISAAIHHHPRTPRGVGWFAVGVLGLPMTAIALLYIFGFAIVLVVFWVSAFCARWPRLAHAFVGLCAVASMFAFGWSASTSDSADLTPTIVLAASGVCGLLSFGKLGRTWAADWRLA